MSKEMLPSVEKLAADPKLKRNTILDILKGKLKPSKEEVLAKFKTEFTNSFSQEVYEETYKILGKDTDINSTFWRVAQALAKVEKPEDQEKNAIKFYLCLTNFYFVPGGRITSNAGADLEGTTLINCFHKSARVLTNKGYKQINEVKIGDVVLTHKNRWRKVVNTLSRKYKGDAFLYKSTNLTNDLICTPEHPFYQGNEQWLMAKEDHKLALLKKDFFAPNSEITIDLYELIKNHKAFSGKRELVVDNNKMYTVSSFNNRGPLITKIQGTPINRFLNVNKNLAYALGRFVGDGSTFSVNSQNDLECDGFNIVFSHKEISELNSIKKELTKAFGIELNINDSKGQDCIYIRKNNILAAMSLRELCGHGFKEKKVPNFIWTASSEIRESFLLGLFDADGCVTKRQEGNLVMNNEKLINDVQALFLSIGYPTVKRFDSTSKAPGLFLSKNAGESFIRKSKKHYSDDRIQSKRNTPADMSLYSSIEYQDVGNEKMAFLKRVIKDTIKYDDYVYNISVEEDQSYIVNNVVVHNCFVDGAMGEDQDSLEGILSSLRRQALTLKSEGGYGFCADFMRPAGGYINGIGNYSPGAVRMLDMWDAQSAVITKGDDTKKVQTKGKKKIRKGAQMVTLSVWHKDIEDFIVAKQTPGRLTKFNMSVLVTDEFMNAVKENKPWDLVYPDYDFSPEVKGAYKKTWDGNLKKWKEAGHPVKVYKTFENANELWDLIIKSTYNRNEPGVLFQDTMNRLNNLAPFGEFISATNPCGEQILPVGGSCLLGSLNWVMFADEDGNFDYDLYDAMIENAVRMMDNVNDISNYPLPHQKAQAQQKRRIGLGVLGYASLLLLKKVRYGSPRALAITEELMARHANAAYTASSNLAKEKGSFPLFDSKLFMKSNYIKNLDPKVVKLIQKQGLRNSHLASIQPTGNSSVFANLVSGGQEPLFSFITIRTKILTERPDEIDVPKIIDWEGKKYSDDCKTKWQWIKEGDDSLLLAEVNSKVYKFDKQRGLLREEPIMDYAVRQLINQGKWDEKAEWAAGAMALSIDDHIKTMEIFARWVDAAASKTVNVPNNYPYEDFKKVYMRAWETGTIKGITTYRDGTMASVLATESSAKKKEDPEHRIVKTMAPKRPKSLPCEMHRVTAEGKPWLVIIGLLENDPYEVFAFKEKELKLSSDNSAGQLVKVKGGEYNLEFGTDGLIKNLKAHFESDAQEALTRMISTSLRHGADVEFIVTQLQKSEGNIAGFSKAIARVLKKYVKEAKTVKCSECGSKNVVMAEGCFLCKDCGSSKCS